MARSKTSGSDIVHQLLIQKLILGLLLVVFENRGDFVPRGLLARPPKPCALSMRVWLYFYVRSPLFAIT
jgi:hypothetical protein